MDPLPAKRDSVAGGALLGGARWKQANGWAYWMKDGETMGERVERFAPVGEED